MDIIDAWSRLYPVPHVAFVDDDTAGVVDVVPAQRWESKLGGAPYLPLGEQWPTRPGRDGQDEPMAFIAQVDLAEVDAFRLQNGLPELLGGHLPRRGLLQFFLPEEDGFGYDDQVDGWARAHCRWWPEVLTDRGKLEPAKVLVSGRAGPEFVDETTTVERFPTGHPRTMDGGHESTPLTQARFPFRLRPALRQDRATLQLPHHRSHDFPTGLKKALYAIDGNWPDELESFITANVARGGTQLGGYPYWTQRDPREDDEGPGRVLLFQLDGSNVTTIGDSGVLGFYIPVEDLPAFELGRVGMYWDCC